MIWPDGKLFAFTIFDDPDSQTEQTSSLVYGLLEELGLRTTKAVWPLAPTREPNSPGETCGNPSFRRHCQQLQERGFEIAFHNATCHSATREETIEALERFRDYFGRDPVTMANHDNQEAIYWGPRASAVSHGSSIRGPRWAVPRAGSAAMCPATRRSGATSAGSASATAGTLSLPRSTLSGRALACLLTTRNGPTCGHGLPPARAQTAALSSKH